MVILVMAVVMETTINIVGNNDSIPSQNFKSGKTFVSNANSSNSNDGSSSKSLDVGSFVNAFKQLNVNDNSSNNNSSGNTDSSTIGYAAVFAAAGKFFSQHSSDLASGNKSAQEGQNQFLSMVESEAKNLMNKTNYSANQSQNGNSQNSGNPVSQAIDLAKSLFQNRNLLTKLAQSGVLTNAAQGSSGGLSAAAVSGLIGSFMGSSSNNSNSSNNNSNTSNNESMVSKLSSLSGMASSFLGSSGNNNNNNNSNSGNYNNNNSGNNNQQHQQSSSSLQGLASSFLNSSSGNSNKQNYNNNNNQNYGNNNNNNNQNYNNNNNSSQGGNSQGGSGLLGQAVNMFLKS